MSKCISKCSEGESNSHTIGVNDLGYIECAECGSDFSKNAIKQELKGKYGNIWEEQWKKLTSLKMRIKALRRYAREESIRLAETVYLLDGIEAS